MTDNVKADPELETLLLTLDEFVRLLEYSRTNPTGVTIGKRWRRLDPDYGWLVCEYVSHPDPKYASIKFYMPIIKGFTPLIPPDAILERGSWSPIVGFANYQQRPAAAQTVGAIVVRRSCVPVSELAPRGTDKETADQ